mgnify:CR=1 FL=1
MHTVTPARTGMTISSARFPDDRDAVLALFAEYVAGLGVDLAFQGVDEEFATLPGKYAPPRGQILIARDGDGRAFGCVAVRPLASGTCEMKRLYVRPEARGRDLGRQLADAIIAFARDAGYRRMVLDTLETMAPAQRLYAALGFVQTAPYYDNPLPGVRYLGRDL